MIVAIDIGTSGFKGALFSPVGECRAMVSLPLPPAELPGGGVECGRWLRAFEECLGRLGELSQAKALVVSGNGPTLVPVTGVPDPDAAGVLRLEAAPARHWLDRGAREESELVSSLMGGYVDPGFFLPKALRIKNREPGLYERTRYFLACPEYLSCALTGVARTVFPSQGFERWYWNADILGQLGLDAAKFPPFIPPGAPVGSLLPSIARRFGMGKGIAGGVPVLAGGPDFFAAILGAAAVSPGDACDRSGTSEGINLCAGERIDDPRLMSYGHPVSPYWNLSGIISTTGGALAWARDILGLGAEPFEEFFRLAQSAEAGAGGLLFLPYLAGERAPIWDPQARGVFAGLSLSTGREELARAVAEGICFAIRDVITVMEELGPEMRNLRVTGRPGRNHFLNQLKADITGKEVLEGPEDAELAGAAALAAAALGEYASVTEAVRVMARTGRVYRGDTTKTARYGELFAEYRGTYQSLKENFARRIP